MFFSDKHVIFFSFCFVSYDLPSPAWLLSHYVAMDGVDLSILLTLPSNVSNYLYVPLSLA